MASSTCASGVSGEGGKRKEGARWKKKFLAFSGLGVFPPPPPSFFLLASVDICELISFTCMNFMRRASPRSGQGSVGWMGVRSSVWEGWWKGKGKLKGEKMLRGPQKERRRWNNRQSTVDLPCRLGYSWKTAAPVSVSHKSRDL